MNHSLVLGMVLALAPAPAPAQTAVQYWGAPWTEQYEVLRRLDDNLLGSAGAGAEPAVELNALQLRTDDGAAHYGLRVEFRGPNWMFIEYGPSLRLLLDGAPVQLSRLAAARGRDGREAVEWAEYELSEAQLQRIARAASVQVQIDGSNFDVQRDFTAANQARFRGFVERCLAGRRVEPAATTTAALPD